MTTSTLDTLFDLAQAAASPSVHANLELFANGFGHKAGEVSKPGFYALVRPTGSRFEHFASSRTAHMDGRTPLDLALFQDGRWFRAGQTLPFQPDEALAAFGPLVGETVCLSQRPWPVNKSIHVMLLDIGPDAELDGQRAYKVLHTSDELMQMLSESCGMYLDDSLIGIDHLPDEPGLYQVKVEYWCHSSVSYEGEHDFDEGLDILDVRPLTLGKSLPEKSGA